MTHTLCCMFRNLTCVMITCAYNTNDYTPSMTRQEKYGSNATLGIRYWIFCGKYFQNDERAMQKAIDEGEVMTTACV